MTKPVAMIAAQTPPRPRPLSDLHVRGFHCGGESHHLENRTGAPVHYLEIGERDGERIFHHKNVGPY